ncbi:MAG: dephospho-CoA kinase [Paenibacillus sp.]|nr:dephospho-CoA kinase [Paenibacillus sp.]
MKRLIAITGGIGSGKSVVSRILDAMGYPVYDCDSRAREIMDNNDAIKQAIADNIAPACIKDGEIDRKELSATVFSSPEKLEILNGIVHGAVRDHLALWHSSEHQADPICFVETAILYQSGLDAMVDEVWHVDAPCEVRVERVMKRNGLSRDEVLARIESQDSFIPTSVHPATKLIDNDGDTAILPQIERMISQVK